MKKIYVFAAILLILAAFCLNSCGGEGVPISAPEHEELACAFVDALSKNDVEAALPLMDGEYFKRKDIEDVFKNARKAIGDFSSYANKGISDYGESEQNGKSAQSAVFRFDTDGADFCVSITRVGNSEKICKLAITSTQTGGIFSMEGASALQWLVLILGLATIVFTVVVFADCVRRKFKSKGTWCAIILLGVLSIGFTVSQAGFAPKAGFGLIISPSSLVTYSLGGYTLSLVIPVGAIAYLVMRKRLLRPEEVQTDSDEEIPDDEEEAPKKEYYEWEE
jgi:hypothetical protein